MSGTALQSEPAARAPAWRGRLLPIVLFGLLAIAPVLAGQGGGYVLTLLEQVMIFAIAALGLDLIVGFGGLVSFGHAAFIGLGAYAAGILAFHGLGDTALALPAAILLSASFAAATGLICLRTRGVYFIMITLAFGQMAFFTASSLAPYGGDDGLTLRMRSPVFGFDLFGNERIFYYATFVAALGIYLFCRAAIASRFGRVLRGAKENPTRMTALGYEVFRYQFAAYVISGAIGGVAGFFMANATNFVSPAYMSWQRSGELIVMLVLGGIGTLDGAVLGAAAYILLSEYLSQLTEHWAMIFGPLLVAVVLFARGGLIGAFRRIGWRA
jgi:branched-chain amino acid transport system permease protein